MDMAKRKGKEPTPLQDYIVVLRGKDLEKVPDYNPLRIYEGCVDPSEAVKRALKRSRLTHETAAKYNAFAYQIGTEDYKAAIKDLKKQQPEKQEDLPQASLEDTEEEKPKKSSAKKETAKT